MKVKTSLSTVAVALLAVMVSGAAQGESTYGYQAAGGGAVIAIARVGITVIVPKVVLLRVGAPGSTQSPVNFPVRITIPQDPSGSVDVDGATSGNADSTPTSWNGSAPTISSPSTPALSAFAWTNGSNVTVNCSATAFNAGGPTLANVAVAATAGSAPTLLDHPGANLGSCSATGALTAGTLHDATWTYTLDVSGAATWAPNSYSSTLTYTATGT